MKKGLCLLGLALFVVGCGSDERQGLVQTTVELSGQVNTRLGVINESVKKAIEKNEKVVNLKEAENYCNELSKLGKQLQEKYQQIQTLKDSLPAGEREKFQEEFKSKLSQSVIKGSEQNLALHDTMQKLKTLAQDNPVHKPAYESLKAKLTEAQGQFETLARLR